MKRYLVAASGMSPQVITETLYALHMEGRMVDGIRIITTKEGKREINANLLNQEDGHYYRFCRDYGINPDTIDFQPKHIIAVKGEHGMELDDISTDEENEAFLRACMETAFELTGLTDTAVFFSIAGGRKTMGACLSVAAQCYGRPQDRIYHVLVSPEFESSRDFYYPPPESRVIELKDSKTREPFFKDTRYARITLVPMPFISVRRSLSHEMLKGPESPQALMLSLVRDPLPVLIVNLKEQKLIWKGKELDLRASWIALYAFFAMTKKEASCDKKNCHSCEECYKTYLEIDSESARIADYYSLTGLGRDKDEMSNSGIKQINAENLRVYRTKINKALEHSFGAHEIANLEISAHGKKPNTGYGILLDRERIRVVM